MENYTSLKVKPDIKKALKIKSTKVDLTLRNLTDNTIREKLVEEGNLSNG